VKKLSNLIFVLIISFMFSGCATALLFTGTVIGGGYAINDMNENYDGDGSEYIKDKTNKLYEAVTAE